MISVPPPLSLLRCSAGRGGSSKGVIHVITDEIYGSCDAFPDDIYIDSKKYINEGISNSGEVISLYKSWIIECIETTTCHE